MVVLKIKYLYHFSITGMKRYFVISKTIGGKGIANSMV
jgi:hypothetical protein